MSKQAQSLTDLLGNIEDENIRTMIEYFRFKDYDQLIHYFAKISAWVSPRRSGCKDS